jgi:hypothetical protein
MATPAQLVSQSRFYSENIYYTQAKPHVKTNKDMASLQISVFFDPNDKAAHDLVIQFCNQLSSDSLKDNTFSSELINVNCRFRNGNVIKNAVHLSQIFKLKTNLDSAIVEKIEQTFHTSVATLACAPAAPGMSASS